MHSCFQSNFALQRSLKGKIENGPMTAGFDNIAHLARQIKSEILRYVWYLNMFAFDIFMSLVVL